MPRTKSTARRKDPEGGLTASGRKYFRKKEGAHLRPGVKGPADTPEKMRRKGSFLRRHYANPRGARMGRAGATDKSGSRATGCEGKPAAETLRVGESP